MHILIGRELTEQSAKAGALRSRPIEKLTLADVVAARPPPGIAAAGRRAGPRVGIPAEQSLRRHHPPSYRGERGDVIR
jgi:hypothetical protein